MRKHYSILSCLAITVVTLLVTGSHAHAQDAGQFNQYIRALHAHRAQVEKQLGLDPQAVRIPHATSYYDDMVDHYEKDQILSDQIDKGIR